MSFIITSTKSSTGIHLSFALHCLHFRGTFPLRKSLIPPKQKFQCDVRASFAKALGNWRHKYNVPLKQVADDLGLSIATVSAWQTGRRFPSGKNFEMLVNYTGVPPCRLFCVMADKCVSSQCQLAQVKKTDPGN